MLCFKWEKSWFSLKTNCFPIVMLIFIALTHLKRSICAYFIALKKHPISPSISKKYYPSINLACMGTGSAFGGWAVQARWTPSRRLQTAATTCSARKEELLKRETRWWWCIPLHCFAFLCIPLHCFTLLCIALQCYALLCIPLLCFALVCIALHPCCIALLAPACAH